MAHHQPGRAAIAIDEGMDVIFSVVACAPRRIRVRKAICIIPLLGIFLYLLIFNAHHQRRGDGWHLGDFPTFYIAAEYALAHRDIYTAQTSDEMIYVYPPLIAFVYTPLTLLPVRHAALVSLLLNTLMLFGSIALGTGAVMRRMDAGPAAFWPAVLLVSILSFASMQAVLAMGETDAIMLFIFTLALYWLDGRPALAGLALAFAMNIKYLPIVALPYLILRRRYKAAAAFVIGTVFFALLPAVLLGWHEDLRCLRVASGGLLRWVGLPPETSHSITVHNIGDYLSVSVTSALARWLGRRGFSNPAIMGAATLVALGAILIVMRIYHARGQNFWRWPDRSRQLVLPFKYLIALEWAGLMAGALAFSPDTNTRHLILAVLVDVVGVILLLTPRPHVSRAPALIGISLIFLAFIMPFGRSIPKVHGFYYRHSIPGCGLLLGYLLIMRTGVPFNPPTPAQSTERRTPR